ncbi:MAG: glutaredoxin 3 [Gammaproteobacteria bacterium]|nr:glutaredoxin 3 [Gammaproteobacteria bacterium]
MDHIEIYSTSHCPWCSRAKTLLRERGLDFEEIDITTDQARAQDMVSRSGRRTVPQIFIDGEPIGGYDELARMDLPQRPTSP